ncbi:MAG: envelope stress response membrane protein PspC [Chitinivibrionales bacterium]|nr:envelope stress response membrane protein PspC [Chitinivibrionales bacterium]
MKTPHNGLPFYRSRRGMIMGVCKGLAERYDLPVVWVRIGVVVLALFTQIFPVLIAYMIFAIVLKPQPLIPLSNEDEHEFYDSYASSRRMALHRLKREFDSLDGRIARMEDAVTNREFSWEKRFNEGR